MQISEKCLPCLVNQAVRVAGIAGVEDRHAFYREIFAELSRTDFTRSNPELLGHFYKIITRHAKNDDPYRDIKRFYDEMFLKMSPEFERRILGAEDPFYEAVKYAAVGNVIDFGPVHGVTQEKVMRAFDGINEKRLAPDDSERLRGDVRAAERILYIGDNCGEIALDRLLIRRMHAENPQAKITFAVRGAPIVNDITPEDAKLVKMDEEAEIISNGDSSQGTVLSRVSGEFRAVYDAADVIIAKGQANFESLSEEKGNIYFLMMVKCAVIAAYTGAKEGSLVCMHRE